MGFGKSDRATESYWVEEDTLWNMSKVSMLEKIPYIKKLWHRGYTIYLNFKRKLCKKIHMNCSTIKKRTLPKVRYWEQMTSRINPYIWSQKKQTKKNNLIYVYLAKCFPKKTSWNFDCPFEDYAWAENSFNYPRKPRVVGRNNGFPNPTGPGPAWSYPAFWYPGAWS